MRKTSFNDFWIQNVFSIKFFISMVKVVTRLKIELKSTWARTWKIHRVERMIRITTTKMELITCHVVSSGELSSPHSTKSSSSLFWISKEFPPRRKKLLWPSCEQAEKFIFFMMNFRTRNGIFPQFERSIRTEVKVKNSVSFSSQIFICQIQRETSIASTIFTISLVGEAN